jgi:hypothetical protein
MKFLSVAIISLCAGLGLGATIQDKKQDKPQDKPGAGAADAMMHMPKPGAEHKELAKWAGTWDAVVKFPDGESKGTANWKVMDGGFWLSDDFKGNFMGTPFVGHGYTGYDPARKKYVSFWCDSMSPSPSIQWGDYDEKTKTLKMSGDNANHEGKVVKTYSTTKHTDDNHVEFKMWEEGKEAEAMTIQYTRKK